LSTNDEIRGADGPGEGESPETGEPIEALAGLAEEPAPEFLGLVRNRINRKVLAVQVTDLSWTAPVLIFLEWLRMFMEWFGASRDESGGSCDE
jgi:hypothetical protein